jgi:hypothetical protein
VATAGALQAVWPAEVFEVGPAAVLAAELLYQRRKIHREGSVPRRKKRPVELPTEDALRKLFPKSIRDEMKQTALNSRKRLTKAQSK